MAISGKNLDEVVREELREEWEKEKFLWFPRTDTPSNVAYDKREPGQWHIIHWFNLKLLTNNNNTQNNALMNHKYWDEDKERAGAQIWQCGTNFKF